MEGTDECRRLRDGSDDEGENVLPGKDRIQNENLNDNLQELNGMVNMEKEEYKIEMDAISPKKSTLKRQTTRREFFLPIHQVVRNGNVEALKCFLNNMDAKSIKKQINSLDDKNMTPLHYASRYNHLAIVKLLLEYGAEINRRGEDDILPLHVASRYRRPSMSPVTDEVDASYSSVIGLLISRGASVNCKDRYGLTPLHYAAMRGNVMAAKELLQNPTINIRVTDKQDMMPLHLATNYGNYKIVELLIEAGSPILVYDEQFQTPLHKAAAEGYSDIVELLLKVAKEESL